MDILFNLPMLTDFLGTTIRLAVPIIFGSVGGLISERSGVFNIALEGSILGGAFGAAALMLLIWNYRPKLTEYH